MSNLPKGGLEALSIKSDLVEKVLNHVGVNNLVLGVAGKSVNDEKLKVKAASGLLGSVLSALELARRQPGTLASVLVTENQYSGVLTLALYEGERGYVKVCGIELAIPRTCIADEALKYWPLEQAKVEIRLIDNFTF